MLFSLIKVHKDQWKAAKARLWADASLVYHVDSLVSTPLDQSESLVSSLLDQFESLVSTYWLMLAASQRPLCAKDHPPHTHFITLPFLFF